MSITVKEILQLEQKYHYLPTKSDACISGKCDDCFAFLVDVYGFCNSTEPPMRKCPLFKRHSNGGRPKKLKKVNVDKRQLHLKDSITKEKI